MSKQSKKAAEYKLNDLVFARVRGYPPWPARIVETGLKYKVIFYGTAETGYIKIEDLFNYEENRESFKKKFAKRKNYQLSLNEITVAWNRRQVLQDFLPKSNSVLDTDVKDVKETKVIENKKQIAQREDAIKPIKPDQIHQLSNAKNSLKKEEEPKPSTSQSNNKKRTRTDSESSVPSKRSKVQHLRDLLDDSYLQGTILKFERKGILYTMYSIAELQKIKAKHEEILSMKENDNFNADTYEFICDYSVALVYEPIIHPVVFGLHITKHRPDEFDGPLARLEWESGMIQDVNHIILDLRNTCKNIQEVVDDYFLDLTDFEELMGTLKIICDTEKFTDVQREAIKRELDILKIVLSIRENVPIEMKDENHLTKAYELLKLIRANYMPDYMPVMKHPVIVECFFKLTKYSCKYELDNKEIIDDIKKEAGAILHDIKQTLKLHMQDEDFNTSFWKTYLSCLKQFRSALASVCRYDFIALTSIEEYERKLKEESTIQQNHVNKCLTRDSGEDSIDKHSHTAADIHNVDNQCEETKI